MLKTNQGKFQCEQCVYETSNSSHIRRHVEAIHEGVRYPCDKCDYQATRRSGLKRHNLQKHEDTVIENSESLFKVEDNMSTIIELCDQSREKSNTEEGIKYEEMNLGTKERKKKRSDVSNSKCEYCDYEASQPWNLGRHVKAVHENFRYPCNQCDYKAKSTSQMHRHEKSIHEGIRYNCDQCDFKSTRKDKLTKHRKLHPAL